LILMVGFSVFLLSIYQIMHIIEKHQESRVKSKRKYRLMNAKGNYILYFIVVVFDKLILKE
jgi:hypothetical protein